MFTYYTRRPLVSALLIIVFLLSFLFIFTTAGAAGIALPPTVLYTQKPLYTATRKSAWTTPTSEFGPLDLHGFWKINK